MVIQDQLIPRQPHQPCLQAARCTAVPLTAVHARCTAALWAVRLQHTMRAASSAPAPDTRAAAAYTMAHHILFSLHLYPNHKCTQLHDAIAEAQHICMLQSQRRLAQAVLAAVSTRRVGSPCAQQCLLPPQQCSTVLDACSSCYIPSSAARGPAARSWHAMHAASRGLLSVKPACAATGVCCAAQSHTWAMRCTAGPHVGDKLGALWQPQC